MAAEYDLCRHLASRPADIFVAARHDGGRDAIAIKVPWSGGAVHL